MALTSLTKLVLSSVLLASTVVLPMTASAQEGIASVYSGERTANGEYAHASGLTAAHRSLPFGTRVRVTNHQTGRSVALKLSQLVPVDRNVAARRHGLARAAQRPQHREYRQRGHQRE